MILIDGYAGVVVPLPFDDGAGTAAGPTPQRYVGALPHNHIAGAKRVIDVRRNCGESENRKIGKSEREISEKLTALADRILYL